MPNFINALSILHIVLERQIKDAVVSHMEQLRKLLEKALKYDNVALHQRFQPLLGFILRMLKDVPYDEQTNLHVYTFLNMLVTTCQDNLTSLANLYSTIYTVCAISENRSDLLEPLLPNAQKAFQRLAKEHISPTEAQQGSVILNTNTAPAPPSNPALESPELVLELLEKMIDLIRPRVSVLGEQRRWFLSAIVQIIERSQNMDLCGKILDMVQAWVFDRTESFPTVKEKVALLTKMLSFETRNFGPLRKRFLELVSTIYESPTTARSELTVRMESAFLHGTRAEDFNTSQHFMSLFDASIPRNVFTRLNYILAIQNWESLATRYWISQAIQLLYGALISTRSISRSSSGPAFPLLDHKLVTPSDSDSDPMIDEDFEKSLSSAFEFIAASENLQISDVLEPLSTLQQLDPSEGHKLWVDLFTMAWAAISLRDRNELNKPTISLLANEYHTRQAERRPNVVITLLSGLAECESPMNLPPHLIKYLGSSFDAWYISLHILEDASAIESPNPTIRENNLDALVEMYSSLAEDDMFYGLWRRRCHFLETNSAMSYEQNGMWDKALHMYESAQTKARTGILPFSESEYHLWEDHWILCAEKLQHWDVLTELARHEGYSDLLLEGAWRMTDGAWITDRDREPLEASIKALMDFPTPRRYIFEAFLALQKVHVKPEAQQEFSKVCDNGIQLCLRKWHSLPNVITQAHIPLLQTFQIFVELHEASQIYGSLAVTGADNLDVKSQELKTILGTWRERLPNISDDINAWSDLVAWRQLVFQAVNRTYLPLVPALQQGANSGNNSSANSFAYRGYHEMAWIINRFAHVARKHQLTEVCISQLTKIYTLPNIEIQEAFLKLREQAKCYYQDQSNLATGLEVISNTNLMYFGNQQKAEFYTLKGMFLARLDLRDEANQAFATAIQIDMTLAKGWAEWGYFNDREFKDQNADITSACHAVSCYLQAASLFRNGKARKILSRVLWLLSFDDAQGSISKAFESYRGEIPVWYWITFVPQLLTSLSHKEAQHVRLILIKIARTFPQV